VMLTTGIRGSVSGTLNGSCSYLMLTPGRILVRTNALTINHKKVCTFPEDSCNAVEIILKPDYSAAWAVEF
jgi:hypothetical protein